MKFKYFIFILIIVVGTYYFYDTYHINYRLLDCIDSPNGLDGVIVCNKENKYYEKYNINNYNVNFNSKSILLTSYTVYKIEKKRDFVRIFVKNMAKSKLNIYLLNQPNLHFNEKDAPSHYIVK